VTRYIFISSQSNINYCKLRYHGSSDNCSNLFFSSLLVYNKFHGGHVCTSLPLTHLNSLVQLFCLGLLGTIKPQEQPLLLFNEC